MFSDGAREAADDMMNDAASDDDVDDDDTPSSSIPAPAAGATATAAHPPEPPAPPAEAQLKEKSGCLSTREFVPTTKHQVVAHNVFIVSVQFQLARGASRMALRLQRPCATAATATSVVR